NGKVDRHFHHTLPAWLFESTLHPLAGHAAFVRAEHVNHDEFSLEERFSKVSAGWLVDVAQSGPVRWSVGALASPLRAPAGLDLGEDSRLRQAPGSRPAGDPLATDGLEAFDAPEEQARFVTRAADGHAEADLLLEGLRCAACAWLVEQAVLRMPGVTGLDVNYATRRAWLRWDPNALPLSAVLARVRRLGYAAWPYEERRVVAVESGERRALLRRF